ncbi:MAG: lysophospholipase [Oscillibacter sp.]|nr:lysophospholipase [Oscillibacter sp.]
MIRDEFEIPSADGRTRLHAVSWRPEGAVRAVLQLSHGLGEHVLRYDPFAEYLTAHGLAVIGHDHLGHGTSIAPDGVRLWFGPKGSWDWLVQDLYALRCEAETRFGELPCFLLGHSMGSFVARTYLIRHPGTVDGCILTGTGQPPAALLRFGYALSIEEGARLGETSVSAVSVALAFGAYNRPFEPVRTVYDWMSADEENIDVFLDSPLCGGSPTVGLLREMMSGLLEIGKPANLRRMNLDTPILLLSGDADPVGDMGKGVRRVERAFRRAGVRDVTMALYPGLRHEILNEQPRYKIYADILRWIQDRS